jgi:hypothetical protein
MLYAIETIEAGYLTEYSLYSNMKKAHVALSSILEDKALGEYKKAPSYASLARAMASRTEAEYYLHTDMYLSVKRPLIK